MKKRWSVWFGLFLLFFSLIPNLLGTAIAFGENTPQSEQTLLDTDALKLKSKVRKVGNELVWEFSYAHQAEGLPEQLKVAFFDNQNAIVEPSNQTNWTRDDVGWLTRGFHSQSSGVLTLKTTTAVKTYIENQAQSMISHFKTIDGATIDDPLGSQFIYANPTNLQVSSVGSTAVTPLPTATITNNNKLTVSNISLGKNQEIQVHYQVRINTEDVNFKPNYWYQMNGQTTLTPDKDNPNNKVDFGIPSGRAPGVTLSLKKIWEEYDDDTSSRPNFLDFSVSRATGSNYSNVGFVRLTPTAWENNQITKVAATAGSAETIWLPKFSNQGVNFTYQFNEINVPEGYEATSNLGKTVWTNKKIFTDLNLNIRKVSNQNQTPLVGAVFELTGGHLSSAVTLTNNNNGYYTTAAVLRRNQTYTLTEITPPLGHAGSGPWTIHVASNRSVTINNSATGVQIDNGTLNYTITNNFKEIPIRAEKYIKGTNTSLTGAKFTVYRYGNQWQGTGTVVGSLNDLIGNDSNSVKNLLPGFYSLKETTVPNGYQEDATMFNFQIDAYGRLLLQNNSEVTTTTKPTGDGWYVETVNGVKRFKFAKYNELRLFEFDLLKQDAHTHAKLVGAQFTLAKENAPNTILANLTTNGSGLGHFIKVGTTNEIYQMAPGKYLVKEITAPTGYVLLEHAIEIEVKADGSVIAVYDNTQFSEDNVSVTLNSSGNNQLQLTLNNTPKGLLPSTGGLGIYPYILVAVLLTSIAGVLGVYYVFANRKEVD